MEKKTLILLMVILLIAGFFRLWRLSSIPPGLYPDEAINGNEAIVNPGQLFYPENNGREGLFISLISLSFSIFGISIWSFKIVPAIIGILTVFGLYILTKELIIQVTNNEQRATNIALLSSFFLAISFWHTNFSRIGFRAILVPFILVFSFYFLFRGFRTKKSLYFIISGVFFGLGFYTYISYRLVVLLLPLVLISFWFVYQKQNLKKQFLLFVVYCLLSIIIVALPIGIYFLKNPENFIGRATPISIFAAQDPIKEFGKSLTLHLGMFNFYGDPNWRHNFATSPMLFWPVGLLFLIGLILSIKDLNTSIKKKNYSLFVVHCSLISWFFIMLLPGILTYEGIPHALRAVGVIPVVYIFAALGGYHLYDWLSNKIKNEKLFIVLCFLFFISLSSAQFYKYFFSWAQNPETGNAFSKDYIELGNYLNSLSPETQKYVIINQGGVPVPLPDGIPMPAQTVMFIERTKFKALQSIYLVPDDLEKIKIDDKKTVIIPLRHDEDLFNKLRESFPQGKIEEENRIWIYNIQ